MGCVSVTNKDKSLRAINIKFPPALKQNYNIDGGSKVLGVGAYGTVFLSHSVTDNSFQVAIKVLSKANLGT